MRRISFITLSAIAAFGLGGCNPDADDANLAQSPTAPSPTTSPTATASPAAPGASPAPGVPATPQGTVAVPTPPPPIGNLPPELIPSTDPDQRRGSIVTNRPDPFSLVPTAPVVQLPPPTPAPVAPPAAPEPAPTPPLLPPPQQPPILQPSPLIPPPPPPPQAVEARAVAVTGVVDVGGVIHAIVKAPNEPTSRYVREGQYLSNGQVLVKRIEVNRADPVVVLEQDGVEVITAVGEGGPPATPGAPTATLPSSPIASL